MKECDEKLEWKIEEREQEAKGGRRRVKQDIWGRIT
jgi:hypothetical protein